MNTGAGWARALLEPRRVALVGASATPGKLGHLLLQNLRSSLAGFRGEVVPIHPNLDRIGDLPAFASLTSVSYPIDLAIIATPADSVPTVMEDCAAAGVPVAVVLTGGFAETGEDGAALQRRVSAIASAGGVRLIGPNCFGVIAPAQGLNASLAMGMPSEGGIALFTQSGAYGMAAFNRSREERIGFSSVVACGNKADLDECDFLEAFGDDPATRVIAMLVESIADGRRFFEIACEVTRKKPVIVLKTGRGAAGQRAAASHTAALATDTAITVAALRQAGIHVVEDGLTLLDLAAALDRQPPLAGRRVGIITNSGGTGVELADLLEARGLEVPILSEALQSSLRAIVPAHGSAANPIDVTTDWQRFGEMYGASLRALLASDEVDAVVPVLLQRSAMSSQVTERVIAEVEAARAAGSQKPVHVCWVALQEADGNRARLLDAGIACHAWPARTAQMLALTTMPPAARMSRADTEITRPSGVPVQGGWLGSAQVFNLLDDAGVPVARWALAGSREQAITAAERLGARVVMKAERPDLIHKSDAGGVAVGLDTPERVAAAYDDMARRLGTTDVLVQEQASAGLELFVGARRDKSFGPMVMVGLGGIWVEALKDVALRLAPVDAAGAYAMLEELKGYALLAGSRGHPGADIDALSELVARLSAFIAAADWVEEMDINPVIANADGLVAVDARVKARPLEATFGSERSE